MKSCNVCGGVKPDDAFSLHKLMPDGLNNTCRECSAERSRQWYIANRDKKLRDAAGYRAAHDGHEPAARSEQAPRGDAEPKPRRTRAAAKKAEALDTEPEDWQMIRFSAGEWLFVLQQAQWLAITPSDYIRILVRDARRRASLTKSETGESQ